ncbi:MAG TPA: helix-turn-helix domain-containing protein, partial [Baekduia sp.]|nr:helix-turn-helix domain-containing protein [Baekduia sp.]
MVPRFELPMSGPAPSAERERADARRNRERILCATARLIERVGIDCMSMDDVAAEAGVGKGTLYRRFGDRSSLLRALISEPEQAFQDACIRGDAPLGPGAPPAERLHAFGEGLLRFLDRHAAYIRAGEALGVGKRYGHPVYAFYQVHVSFLLRQAQGD